jgi:hypothetical protein
MRGFTKSWYRRVEALAVDELDEDATRRARVYEGDLAQRAAAWSGVDELDARCTQTSERSSEIVDHETDVVERGATTLGDEAGNARSGVGRLDELDPLSRVSEEDNAHLLIGQLVDRAYAEAQRIAEERERIVDAWDRDRDVVYRARHDLGGEYVPKTSRSSVQISPSVTPASTAATIGGMRFAVPCAAPRRSSRADAARDASRCRRTAASLSR